MPRRINKLLITLPFLETTLNQTGVNASSFFDDEKPTQTKPAAQKPKAPKSFKEKRNSTINSSQQSLNKFFSPSKRVKLAENWGSKDGKRVMYLDKWETLLKKNYRIVITRFMNLMIMWRLNIQPLLMERH